MFTNGEGKRGWTAMHYLSARHMQKNCRSPMHYLSARCTQHQHSCSGEGRVWTHQLDLGRPVGSLQAFQPYLEETEMRSCAPAFHWEASSSAMEGGHLGNGKPLEEVYITAERNREKGCHTCSRQHRAVHVFPGKCTHPLRQ